jgi:putative ABC transport system permease protein
MNFNDILHETFAALLANKARTGLTMLGIVIGIGSVIALVSVGQGAQAAINSSIQSLGSNLIMITPGAQRAVGGGGVSSGRGSAESLKTSDADAIESVQDVAAVAPSVQSSEQVTAKGTNTRTTVVGTTASYAEVRNVDIDEGSFLSQSNDTSGAKVAVLGPTTRDDLFGAGAEAIGQSIRINGQQFKVIGITVAKGGSGFTSQDDIIYIPLKTAQQYLTGSQYVSTISVEASSQEAMTQVQNDITDLLLQRHKIKDPANADFSIINQNDIVSTASSITGTFTLLLGAIAGISLLVGGIGIMNMMLTTVTERTREIGLRKAIGAKRADISRQFLIEAIALTGIGGLAGIVLGWGASLIVTATGLVTTQVTLSSVLLAVGVSGAIGIIFGYYPARRAAALNPIEALRYE